MKDLYQVIYLSSATYDFKESDLEELLLTTRKRNHDRKITGLLLYSDGNFIGVLEGPKLAVQQLTRKIERDTRHCGFKTVWFRPKNKRDFPEYQIAYKNCKHEMSAKYPYLHKIVDKPQSALAQISCTSKEIQIMIKTFLRVTNPHSMDSIGYQA